MANMNLRLIFLGTMKKAISLIPLLLTLVGAGCTPLQPTTGLYEKAHHTGTVTLLRVDAGWRGPENPRKVYKLGSAGETVKGKDSVVPPFVPLRDKNDIAGLDGPGRVVTDEDLVTVTLKSVFVKYFKEFDGDDRKGEIALVLSFEAGGVAKESLLIYSSEGQTLGSLLALDDMPIIGPITLPGDDIMVRLVMIELDQVENESRKQFIRAAADLASTFSPGASSALSIPLALADFIISQNVDDVIEFLSSAGSRA
jgi:hypothetical protein